MIIPNGRMNTFDWAKSKGQHFVFNHTCILLVRRGEIIDNVFLHYPIASSFWLMLSWVAKMSGLLLHYPLGVSLHWLDFWICWQNESCSAMEWNCRVMAVLFGQNSLFWREVVFLTRQRLLLGIFLSFYFLLWETIDDCITKKITLVMDQWFTKNNI